MVKQSLFRYSFDDQDKTNRNKANDEDKTDDEDG